MARYMLNYRIYSQVALLHMKKPCNINDHVTALMIKYIEEKCIKRFLMVSFARW